MRKFLIFSIVILVSITALLMLKKSEHIKPQRVLVPVVTIAPVAQRAEPVVLEAPGLVDAYSSVTVRSQISGIITKIDFTPGQFVQAGQVLFEINSANYQANLAEATANLQKDNATLDLLQKEKPRYDILRRRGDVSAQEYDEFIAKLKAQIGAVAADKALINQNKIARNYATIKTPIAGKTGNVLVKVGDLVSPSDLNPLVVVNQLDPVNVNFYLSQNLLSQVLKYSNQKTLIAELYSEDKKRLLATGELSFIDNTIDPTTGTALLKAAFANPQHSLWIGESTVVKLILTIESNALVIPIRAVQSDQQGQFVYLLKQNNAVVQHIVLDRQVDDWAVIRSGLALGDKVLVVFPPNLQDGEKVVVASNVPATS